MERVDFTFVVPWAQSAADLELQISPHALRVVPAVPEVLVKDSEDVQDNTLI